MKIVTIGPDRLAVAELDGSRQDVDLSLLPSAQPGDYVIVHAGYAIERLDEAEARKQLELFQELAAIWK